MGHRVSRAPGVAVAPYCHGATLRWTVKPYSPFRTDHDPPPFVTKDAHHELRVGGWRHAAMVPHPAWSVQRRPPSARGRTDHGAHPLARPARAPSWRMVPCRHGVTPRVVGTAPTPECSGLDRPRRPSTSASRAPSWRMPPCRHGAILKVVGTAPTPECSWSDRPRPTTVRDQGRASRAPSWRMPPCRHGAILKVVGTAPTPECSWSDRPRPTTVRDRASRAPSWRMPPCRHGAILKVVGTAADPRVLGAGPTTGHHRS
jgi:hypothetical protein